MSNAIAVSDIERAEHNGTFGVKKVAVYNDDGAGNLSLQPKTATEETLQAGIAPSGTDTDFSVTLTNASTAYALFAAPASAYELTIYNGSDSDIFIRKTTGTTLGVLLPAGGVMNMTVGANKQIFSYCASAGKVLQGFYTLY
jgi:hypothetical protein